MSTVAVWGLVLMSLSVLLGTGIKVALIVHDRRHPGGSPRDLFREGVQMRVDRDRDDLASS